MILVTGASGTVGSLVVGELIDRGVEVRAGVHRRAPGIDGVESRRIDLGDPETLPPALEGVREVFLVSPSTLDDRAIVPAAEEAGVERIVKLSSSGAESEDFLSGRVSRAVEREIERSDLEWTFLRPTYFMQNFTNYYGETIREEDAFYDSVADARISHVDCRDVARVAARVLTEPGHEGEAYPLTGPEGITHEEIARILSRTLGRKIEYVRISDEELRESLLSDGVPEGFADSLVSANRVARTGADSAVTTHVSEITGREPTSFETFARDHASELEANA